MSKVDEWKKHTPKLIGGNGDKDFSYVVRPDQVDQLIQLVRDECDPKWVSVDGYKEVPKGLWLVKMEKDLCGSEIHVMKNHGNIAVVGSVFAFDAPKILAYKEIPL